MKKIVSGMSYLLLCGMLLCAPQQASAGAMQEFCSVHDQKLAQDMATSAAALMVFHGAVSMTCTYIAITYALEMQAKGGHGSIHPLSKTVPRAIAASKGFFKVMVPSSKKVYEGLKNHNEYWAKVFQGSFKGSMNSGMASARAMNNCRKVATGLHHLRTVMLAAMAYLAVSKSICAVAKAIDPHCKRSSKHKNKCVLPIYNELSIVPTNASNGSDQKTSCSGTQGKKLDDYFKLVQSYGSRLKAMAAFNKKFRKLLGPIAKGLRKGKPAVNSIKNGLNRLKPSFKPVHSILKKLNKGLKPLGKLLSRKVCVSIKVVGKKRVCKKIKIAGKKKKKCTWKLTSSKKNVCSSIKNISKMAASIQKPMDKIVDKMAKPILKLLPKSLPLPGLSKAKSLGRKMKNALSIGKIKKLNKALKTAKRYIGSLKQLHTKLQSVRQGLR